MDTTKSEIRDQIAENILLNLTEVRHWYNVSAEKENDQTVIRGQPLPGVPFQTVLPLGGTERFSVKELREMVKNHKEIAQTRGDEVDPSLVLGLSSADTTCVMYRLHDGIIPPKPLHVSQQKRQMREQIFQHRKERRLNAQTLLEQEQSTKERRTKPESFVDESVDLS